jgi:hypothetical protein
MVAPPPLSCFAPGGARQRRGGSGRDGRRCGEAPASGGGAPGAHTTGGGEGAAGHRQAKAGRRKLWRWRRPMREGVDKELRRGCKQGQPMVFFCQLINYDSTPL